MEHTRSASNALTGSLGEPVMPFGAATESVDAATESVDAETASVHAITMEDLFDSKCYYHAAGWWTYELCIGYHVRQFHVISGQSLEQISTLGEYIPCDRALQALHLLHAGTGRTANTCLELLARVLPRVSHEASAASHIAGAVQA